MDTTTIPNRWVTSRQQVVGRAEAVGQAWIDAGKPAPFEVFRKGYDAHREEVAKDSAGPKELVAELEVHGRLLYIASRQMSFTQRAAYAQQAHKGGDDVGEDYARTNERDALIKRFGGARA